jgi:arsenite methyltransferase
LLYVKFGKFRHRDFMLGLHAWRGDENVLDVGCGRGLLLAGAAKRIASLRGIGHVTGIDVWSNVDMGGNSAAATQRNLDLEGVSSRCSLVSRPAQDMSFPDATFDVILSNLCIHNIYDAPARREALSQIVRVLKPGGIALISDYKRTGEYADAFRKSGLIVEKRHGSFLTTFPPLTVVVARKPM